MLADWTVPTVGDVGAAVHVSVGSTGEVGKKRKNDAFCLRLSSQLSVPATSRGGGVLRLGQWFAPSDNFLSFFFLFL